MLLTNSAGKGRSKSAVNQASTFKLPLLLEVELVELLLELEVEDDADVEVALSLR